MGSLNDLHAFCSYLVSKYGSPDLASEEQKAEEFRDFYFRGLPVNRKSLRAVARVCGLDIHAVPMPPPLRGYSELIDGRGRIYYREDDCTRGVENTIPHEIREMMEPIFSRLCAGYRPLRTSAVHRAANRFAAALLLPREEYKKKVYRTGFDVLALGELYPRAYSQLLLRIAEVIDGELFFYGALYELLELPGVFDPRLVVTYWTRSFNRCSPWANYEGTCPIFARRGHQALPGSPVGEAVRLGQPQLAERIPASEDGETDLTAIAQPLLLGEEVVRVALVVVLYQDKEVLQPQIDRVQPMRMDAFLGERRWEEDYLLPP
jgi:hypothetical protein